MRRHAAAALLLGLLSGCMNLDTGPDTGGRRPLAAQGFRGQGAGPPEVPGVQGPYGTPVPMAAPYNSAPPGNQYAAMQMMSRSVPLSMVQMNHGGGMMGGPPLAMPGGQMLSPPGMPFAPNALPGGSVNPTSSQPMLPNPVMTQGNGAAGDIQQAQFAMNPANAGIPQPGARTQVRFLRPTGMQVSWFAQGPGGQPMYSPTPIDTPGKYNFLQGARYRLKLTNLPGRPGVELYPTLEVVPGNHKSEAFLAHSSVPVEFTDEDLKQIAEGNYVVKVIYLPDPQNQDVAGTGTDEILSTRLEPGQDPIQEAVRRGTVLLVIRMGNIDQEAPNTPPLAAPPSGPVGIPPGMMNSPFKFGPTQPGVMTPPVQVPYWGMNPGGALGTSPGAVPPGLVPPGTMPGAIPPGMVPPGMVPPGMVPPGMVPPGFVPPGAAPGATPPNVAPPGLVPQNKFPPTPTPVPPAGTAGASNSSVAPVSKSDTPSCPSAVAPATTNATPASLPSLETPAKVLQGAEAAKTSAAPPLSPAATPGNSANGGSTPSLPPQLPSATDRVVPPAPLSPRPVASPTDSK